MKRLGEAQTPDEQSAEAAIQAASVFDDEVSYALLVPDVVSPVHRGVESAVWRVAAGSGDVDTVLKVMRADMRPFFDAQAAVAGVQMAGELGVGPAVRWADAEQGAVALDLLPEDWRTAGLYDLQHEQTMASALAAVRRLHQGDALAAEFDVFAEVKRLEREARAEVDDLPPDLWRLMGDVADIGQAVHAAGRDLAPCRNDGAASNLMIGPDGSVMLLDFDRAGMNDPIYDLGVLIAEAHPFASEAARTVEIWCGRFEAAVLDRALLYGAADDLMWGLWGLIAAVRSPRRHVEFRKYGEWRLMRCRSVLADPRFEERLRGL